jgi:hypothetical protein
MRIPIREMDGIKRSSRRLFEFAGYVLSDGLHHSRRARQFVDHDQVATYRMKSGLQICIKGYSAQHFPYGTIELPY